MSKLRIKNRSESDLRNCEVAVTNKVQKARGGWGEGWEAFPLSIHRGC